MLQWLQNFKEATPATKGFILTLVIMGLVIIASIFWGYAMLNTRRSGPKAAAVLVAKADSSATHSTRVLS